MSVLRRVTDYNRTMSLETFRKNIGIENAFEDQSLESERLVPARASTFGVRERNHFVNQRGILGASKQAEALVKHSGSGGCTRKVIEPGIAACRDGPLVRVFLFEGVKGLLDQFVSIVELAALNLRAHALFQLGLMELDVHCEPCLPFSIKVNRDGPPRQSASVGT